MGCAGSKKKGTLDVTLDDIEETKKERDRKQISDVRIDEYRRRHRGASPTTTELPPDPPPVPKIQEEQKAVLRVLSVDFNIASNTDLHSTDLYEITKEHEIEGTFYPPQLVIRRGQTFDVTIQTDRTYNSENDFLCLVFDVGPRPRESKGTRFIIPVSDKELTDQPNGWTANCNKVCENFLTISIKSPANCAVAKWKLSVDTRVKMSDGNMGRLYRFQQNDSFYIIFNPWCQNDHVYLNDEPSRKEYVLNDSGIIYKGTHKNIYEKPWNYGQFNEIVLDCCMSLLNKSGLTFRMRGSAVHVVRKIAALVNSADDQGVLVGKWSGDYATGTPPLSWIGSIAILHQYWKTHQPVKYGQCWVFSALCTTVCRALGIPSRCVSNYSSAHDCDGSITMDVYWTADGRPIDKYNHDSIWNFHTWTEVWTVRADLPAGYGGWQIIDSTPQQTSDGVFCTGPCSVEAVKNGLVNLPYDTAFVFSEVNADKLNWIQDGPGWRLDKEHHVIGKKISTKGIGNNERVDITGMYKFPEGSRQERTAVWRAVKEGSARKEIYEIQIEDMAFNLLEKNDTIIGQPIEVNLYVDNNGSEHRTVAATLNAAVIYYTGVIAQRIKSDTYTIQAPAGAGGYVTMTMLPEEYLDKLVDMGHIQMSCMVQVTETNQYHCQTEEIRLVKPQLNIQIPVDIVIGRQVNVDASFVNPLSRALTRCEFSLEGPSIQKPLKMKHETVGPHGEAKVTFQLTPKHIGQRTFVVGFDSKELSELSGSFTLNVSQNQ